MRLLTTSASLGLRLPKRVLLFGACFLAALGSIDAHAQGAVDGRFLDAVDFDAGTYTVTVQLRADPGAQGVGTSTVQFLYNNSALTYQSGAFDGYQGARSSYTGGTAFYSSTITHPSADKVSLNIEFTGSTDGHGEALTNAWTDVATLQFSIENADAFSSLTWGSVAVFTGPGAQYTNRTFETTSTVLPVELTRFDAVADARAVLLTWETASETNNAGFEIEHRRDGGFRAIGFVAGAGSTTESRHYRHPVEGLEPGRHVFRLKQVDFDGTFAYSPEVEVNVAMPAAFVLEPAYPNPFNPTTTLRFAVREARAVRVELYDAMGRLVNVLYSGVPASGETLSVHVDGGAMASGAYFVRLAGEGGIHAVQRILLVK